MIRIIILKCPKCKHLMKYQAKNMILKGKRKACVYCGKTFLISENIIKN